MTSPASKQLNEVADLNDSLHQTPEYVEIGYPMVRVTDIRRGFLNLFGTKRVSHNTFAEFTKRYAPRVGDILFSRVGSYGNSCFIDELAQFCLGENTVCISPRIGHIDPFFLYSCLNSAYLRNQIDSLVGGASQPTISLKSISTLQLPCPEMAVQKRIGSILYCYDSLIEHNTRRIKILEQMAQMLYREWFVDFRFPDHEKAKMVESELGLIPTGWNVKRMDEVAEVIDCLHSKKPDHVDDGTGLLLQLFNIGDSGKLDLSKKFRVTAEVYKLWTCRIEVCAGDCVITNVGRIAAVAQIPEGVRRPRRISPTFLIEYLLSPIMAAEVVMKKDAGAIMDSLNVKGIVRLSVPIPPESLAMEFERVARPLRRQVEVLMQKNSLLRATRDMLLPKLVSGEVSVEQIKKEAVAQMV